MDLWENAAQVAKDVKNGKSTDKIGVAGSFYLPNLVLVDNFSFE